MNNDTIVIPLSKTGKYAGMYEALVSPEDADLAELNWTVLIAKSTQYARRKQLTEHGQQDVYLHRVILERILGRELRKGEHVDHIDGDGLNNRHGNLRLATHAQNLRNRGKQGNNTSGYKGVGWHKRNNKWHAQIKVNGKNKHLGYFDTAELAHKAYCEAADELHKKFANYGD